MDRRHDGVGSRQRRGRPLGEGRLVRLGRARASTLGQPLAPQCGHADRSSRSNAQIASWRHVTGSHLLCRSTRTSAAGRSTLAGTLHHRGAGHDPIVGTLNDRCARSHHRGDRLFRPGCRAGPGIGDPVPVGRGRRRLSGPAFRVRRCFSLWCPPATASVSTPAAAGRTSDDGRPVVRGRSGRPRAGHARSWRTDCDRAATLTGFEGQFVTFDGDSHDITAAPASATNALRVLDPARAELAASIGSEVIFPGDEMRGTFIPARPPRCRVVLVTNSSGQQQWVSVC